MILNLKKFKIKTSPESAEINTLRAGDIVRRQYTDNDKTIYSLMYVEETGVDKIKTDNGEKTSHYFVGQLLYGDEPKTGELLNFVRITSLSETDRNGAIYLTSNDEKSPFMDVLEVASKTNAMFYPDNVFSFSKPASNSISFNKTERTFKFENISGVDVSFESEKIKNNTKFAMVYFEIKSSKTAVVDLKINSLSKKINSTKDYQSVFIPIATDELGADFTLKFESKTLNINGDNIEIRKIGVFSIEVINGLLGATQSRIGKLDGIVDEQFGKLEGYGGYFQKLYSTKDVNIAGTFTAGDKNGFSSVFYVGKINTNLINNSMSLNLVAPKAKETKTSIVGIGNTYEVTSDTAKFSFPVTEWIDKNINKPLYFSMFVYSEKEVTVDVAGAKVLKTEPQWQRVGTVVYLNDKKDVVVTVQGKGTKFTAPQIETGESMTLYQPTDGKLSITDKYGMWASEGGFGGTIQNPLLKINENGDGSIRSKNDGFVLNKDGSGSLGGGAITFDKEKVKISFKDSNIGAEVDSINKNIDDVKKDAKNANDKIDGLEIGGRNYALNSENERGEAPAGSTYDSITTQISPKSPFVSEDLIDSTISYSFHVTQFITNNNPKKITTGVYNSTKNKWLELSKTFVLPNDGIIKNENIKIYNIDPEDKITIYVYKGESGKVVKGDIVSFDKLTINKATKVSDWTLAPEDIQEYTDKQIQDVRVDFDITAEKINSNITETKKLVDETSGLVKRSEETATQIEQTAKQVETTASQVKENAESVEKNTTTVTQTAESVKTVAESVEKNKEEIAELKTSVETTAEGVNVVASEVGKKQTEINATAEGVNVKAKEVSENAEKAKLEAEKANKKALEASTKAEEANKKAEEALASSGSASQAYKDAKAEADKATKDAEKAKLEADKATKAQSDVAKKQTEINQTAETIQTTAKEVSDNATSASTSATKAKSNADSANKASISATAKAKEAEEASLLATAKAEEALASAGASSSAYQNAKAESDKAEKEANKAKLDAKKATDEALKAKTEADKALASQKIVTEKETSITQTAGEIQTTAKEVSENAEKAEQQAKLATDKATSAQTSATSAQAEADKANKKAEEANKKAEEALASAGESSTAYQNAKKEAEKANAEATKATSQATKAQTEADKAKKEADKALASQNAITEKETAINQTAEKISTTATAITADKEAIEEMKTSVEQTATSVSATAEEVGKAKTSIDLTSEKITTTATKVDADAKKAEASAKTATDKAKVAQDNATTATAKANEANKKAEEALVSAGASSQSYKDAKAEAEKANAEATKANAEALKAKTEADKAVKAQQSVTTMQTEINQTAEKISTTATEVSTNATKAQTSADNASKKAIEAQANATKAKTEADSANKKALEAQANADKTKADATASNQAKIDAQKKADEAKAEANKATEQATKSQTEATRAKNEADKAIKAQAEVTKKQTEINQTATEVNASAKKATESAERSEKAEASINLKADGIVMEASKQSAEKAIEGLEIGGVNLWRIAWSKTKVDWGTDGGTQKFTITNDGFMKLEVGNKAYAWKFAEIYNNTKFSVSVDVLIPIDSKAVGANIRVGGTGSDIPTKITKGKWTRIKNHISFSSISLNRHLSLYVEGEESSYAFFKNIKVENGNKATDWTPAPEDMATQENLKAEVKILDTKISTKVEKTEYNTNNQKINQDISQINQKADNISTTVSSNKKDADSKISKVDQKADNISTTVATNKKDADGKIQSNKSAIEQNSKSITALVQSTDQLDNRVKTAEVKLEPSNIVLAVSETAKIGGDNYLISTRSGNEEHWMFGDYDKDGNLMAPIVLEQKDKTIIYNRSFDIGSPINYDSSIMTPDDYFTLSWNTNIIDEVGYIITNDDSSDTEIYVRPKKYSNGRVRFKIPHLVEYDRVYFYPIIKLKYNINLRSFLLSSDLSLQWGDFISAYVPSSKDFIGKPDVQSGMSIEPNNINLWSKKISLNGAVTFSSLYEGDEDDSETIIHNGFIKTSLIEANKIVTGDLIAQNITAETFIGKEMIFDKGTIGGWVINKDNLTGGDIILGKNGEMIHKGGKWGIYENGDSMFNNTKMNNATITNAFIDGKVVKKHIRLNVISSHRFELPINEGYDIIINSDVEIAQLHFPDIINKEDVNCEVSLMFDEKWSMSGDKRAVVETDGVSFMQDQANLRLKRVELKYGNIYRFKAIERGGVVSLPSGKKYVEWRILINESDSMQFETIEVRDDKAYLDGHFLANIPMFNAHTIMSEILDSLPVRMIIFNNEVDNRLYEFHSSALGRSINFMAIKNNVRVYSLNKQIRKCNLWTMHTLTKVFNNNDEATNWQLTYSNK